MAALSDPPGRLRLINTYSAESMRSSMGAWQPFTVIFSAVSDAQVSLHIDMFAVLFGRTLALIMVVCCPLQDAPGAPPAKTSEATYDPTQSPKRAVRVRLDSTLGVHVMFGWKAGVRLYDRSIA